MYYKHDLKIGDEENIAVIPMCVVAQVRAYLDWAGCWYELVDLDLLPEHEWHYMLGDTEYFDQKAVAFRTVCEKQSMLELADEIYKGSYEVEDMPGNSENGDTLHKASEREIAEQMGEYL